MKINNCGEGAGLESARVIEKAWKAFVQKSKNSGTERKNTHTQSDTNN